MKSFLTLLLAAVLLSGCVNLERGYPDKRFFVLEVSGPASAGSVVPVNDDILQVSMLRISPRYQDRSFIYRVSDTGYESDFYNQFLAPPAGLISEEIRKGLIAAQLFKFVISPASTQAPSYVLDGFINGIYGDFRNLSAPAGVIDLEIFLTSDVPAKPGILMQKRYVKSVPVSSRSPEALVKSWDQALEEIVTALAGDLKTIK
jgi:ABC-type uncharacterized transport system auxiliary subunit